MVESSARRTNEAVELARQVMGQVVGGITDIRSESKAVADAILTLNEDLQQVSKIAQVINAVAERSDLLALNAALEGTKAGEVGRGFSLVAAEMRKLAESVSQSAQDIGRIVERVQESGDEAVAKARAGVSSRRTGAWRWSSRPRSRSSRSSSSPAAPPRRRSRSRSPPGSRSSRRIRRSQGARNVADLVKQGVDATERTTKIAADLQSVAQALAQVTGRFRVRN